MLLPIRTDRPPRHRPTVNYVLIGLNVAIFLALEFAVPVPLAGLIKQFGTLDTASPQLHQFVSYAFLHGGWMHLIGNMVFLYIFGNSLNDKLGHVEYLLFYLAGAIFSGAGYCLVSVSLVVGASGAIAAVTTGFLVLFPRSRILVLFWLYIITTFEVSSLVLIGFKMILWDNVLIPMIGGAGNVAHEAHLFGYLFGFVIPLVLLAAGILPRDQFDIFSLWKQAYRRYRYRQMVRTAQKPLWVGMKQARPVRPDVGASRPAEEEALPADEHSRHLVAKIAESIDRYDLATAAELYLKLIDHNPDAVLPRRQQLDVANQLMSNRQFGEAAEAYEKYLRAFPAGEQIAQVRLLLGILYGRHLGHPDRARAMLEEARRTLGDPTQRNLCQAELDRLGE